MKNPGLDDSRIIKVESKLSYRYYYQNHLNDKTILINLQESTTGKSHINLPDFFLTLQLKPMNKE